MAGLSLDNAFDEAFYTGSTGQELEGDVPYRFPVSIGGHPYEIDFKNYRRTTLQVRRLATDESVEPGEQSLNAAGEWPRAQENWFLGAGQEFLDNRFAFVSVYVHSGEDPSVRTRFWRSLGLNPWTAGKMQMLPGTQLIRTSANTGLKTLAVNGYLYVADGTEVYWTNNPTSASPTWTAANIQAGQSPAKTVTGITTDGSRVWAALGVNGVTVTALGASSSTVASTPPALANPQGLTATNQAGSVGSHIANATAYDYAVTAVDAFGNETLPSATVSITSTGTAEQIALGWGAVTNAVTYNVYKAAHSGTLKQTWTGLTTATLIDNGQTALGSTNVPGSNGTGSTQQSADNVGYALGYLVASYGPKLMEIFADGTFTVITTNNATGWTWDGFTNSPGAILAWGHSGSKSGIYGIQPSSSLSAAVLGAPFIVSNLPIGETVNQVVYNAGSIILATSLGIRTGTPPNVNGTFDINPVILDPGNSLCAAAWSNFAYFGWSSYNTADDVVTPGQTWSGLGRADLAQYTTPGVPAYTTDVMAPSGTTGSVTSCCVIAGTPYFAIDGVGIFGCTAAVVSSANFETGWLRYGTLENKTLMSVDFQANALAAGQSVTIQVANELGVITTLGTFNTAGAIGPVSPFGAEFAEGEKFMLIFTLNSAGGADTTGVTLRSWRAMAMVTPPRQDEILVPILLSDDVRTMEGAGDVEHYDTLTEFQFLKNLERLGQPTIYTEGKASYQVVIDQIEVRPTAMNNQRSFFNGQLTVKLITLL